MAVIPSVLIGGLQVFQTVMEQNFSNYMNDVFSFSETQVVKSEIDMRNREVSVSLVGTQIPDDVIRRLEQSMTQYNLENYSLHVTQNKISQTDNSDLVTIAVQEKTIQDLQAQIDANQEKLDTMEAVLEEQLDCRMLSKKAEQIFTKLADCSCGVMSDQNGDYILMIASAAESLLPEEEETIQNWLLTETGLSRAELRMTEVSRSERYQ